MPTSQSLFRAIWLSLITFAVLIVAQAQAAEGRRGADRLPPPRETKEEAGDYLHGRTVIYRSGEMPRMQPADEVAKRTAAERVRRPHNLTTPLPVIIQGAPNRLAMRRYGATG